MSGLRLILDLVPNHSSDQHEWFAKSLKKEEPYSDYYVWAKPKNHAQVAAKGAKPEPPSNWVTIWTHMMGKLLLCTLTLFVFPDQCIWRFSLGIQ
jgi:glycosidase